MKPLWKQSAAIAVASVVLLTYAVPAVAGVIAEGGGNMKEAATQLTVEAIQTGEVSPLLYGACLEDVNHEVYGGVYAQMIYGEHFAEAVQFSAPGLASIGSQWQASDGVLSAPLQSNGPKLMLEGSEGATQVSAQVYMNAGDEGPVGLIVKVTDPKAGADSFNGYEIALLNNLLRVGKHQYNYSLISETPVAAPAGQWNTIRVDMSSNSMRILINGSLATTVPVDAALSDGAVGLRAWNCNGRFRNLVYSVGAETVEVEIPTLEAGEGTTTHWKQIKSGTAEGKLQVTEEQSLSGNSQSQRITFTAGNGTVGIANLGLNSQGMCFRAEKPYEGYFYARSTDGADLTLAIESRDGQIRYAQTQVAVSGREWTKYSFTLTPCEDESDGRFVLLLEEPGSLDLGYVYLSPGDWGLYQGLPFRSDVMEALQEEGLTVLRYGGSMINPSTYRWKQMTGPREFRPNYAGHWYPYSSNGFGVFEFMELAEALGVVGIPDLNSFESPADVLDFVRFATGTDPADPWVQLRADMGHPAPFALPYLEIGNEERVDESYAARFNAIADAVWAYDPDVLLVVGDFSYHTLMTDPEQITGADSGITDLKGQKAILEHASAAGRDVWFDIHIWNDGVGGVADSVQVAISYYQLLKAMAPDVDARLPVFELNANSHGFSRSMGTALATLLMAQHPEIFPIVCSANCLQVDGQNDNGWDQGLVFLNPSQAWFAPAAYMVQLLSAAYAPCLVPTALAGDTQGLTVTAACSENGETYSILLVNTTGSERDLAVSLPGLTGDISGSLQSYAADNSAMNSAATPDACVPSVPVADGMLRCTLPVNSCSVLTVTTGSGLPGDMNRDGICSVTDVVLLRKAILNNQFDLSGDMNQDGSLTVTDVVLLRKAILAQDTAS